MPLRFLCACFVAALLACHVSLHAQDMPLSDLLIDGEGWHLVSEGHKFTEGPAVDDQGNVFFVDVPESKIFKISASDGKVSVFVADSGKASGLMFGGDGRLYAAQSGKQGVAAYDAAGKETTIASGIPVNDLVVTKDNHIYVTDLGNKQVWHIDPQGNKKVADLGIEKPNGLILWPDQKTLVVSDFGGNHLWAFRIATDGSLQHRQPYYTVQLTSANILAGKAESGGDGMTVDKDGRIYVCTHAGLQVFDTQGRLSGIIAKPQEKFLSNVTYGGEKLDTLYVTCLDKVYSRKTKTTGLRNWGK